MPVRTGRMHSIPQVIVKDADPDHAQNLGRQNATDQLTPDEYARAVQNFAYLPNGQGRAFQPLAEYLSHSIAPSSAETSESFVTVYTLDQTTSLADENSLGENTLLHARKRRSSANNARFFKDPDTFFSHNTSSQASQIIFLRGYPSPKWLNCIGAKYQVDPEFFRRHLDILSQRHDANSYSEPCLPSSLWHLLQLPVYTLGIKHDRDHSATSVDSDVGRTEARNALSAHHRRLRLPHVDDSRLGDSIVRDYHILDNSHFVIEQRISICLQEFSPRYVLLVWLDSTLKWNDPIEEPWCPRAASQTHPAVELLPVVCYRRNLGLMSHRMRMEAEASTSGPPQSAALVHLDYVRSRSQSAIRQDASYALADILRLAAASKSQLLNLLNIGLALHTPDHTTAIVVPSLIHNSQILTYLLQQIYEVQQSMKNTANSHWPKASGIASGTANTTWIALKADYDCLHERTKMISERYKEVIVIFMNTMAIAESREAITQAKKVSRLTFLAFIFVPLSFTTSLFGMNVKQLNQQTTSIWYWVIVSIVILGIAMAWLYSEKYTHMLEKAGARFVRMKSPRGTSSTDDSLELQLDAPRKWPWHFNHQH